MVYDSRKVYTLLLNCFSGHQLVQISGPYFFSLRSSTEIVAPRPAAGFGLLRVQPREAQTTWLSPKFAITPLCPCYMQNCHLKTAEGVS